MKNFGTEIKGFGDGRKGKSGTDSFFPFYKI